MRMSDYEITIKGPELEVHVKFRNAYDAPLIQGILNHISRKEDWGVNFKGKKGEQSG